MEIEDIPKPNFSDINFATKTRSPPRRSSRQKKHSFSLDTASLDVPDAEIRSFCNSKGLSEMALRCGMLPPSLEHVPLPVHNNTETLQPVQPVPHPYAAQQKLSHIPHYDPLTFPADLPPMDMLDIPELGTEIPGPTTTITKKARRNSRKQDDEGLEVTEADISKAKGLRHFSNLVMAKVEQKGTTTYNEVSEELVEEIKAAGGKGSSNIKRRVYDALNVLRAIHIIDKQKKSISWVGLPQHSAQALDRLQQQKREILSRIEQKREHYKEMSKQLSGYQIISSRNKLYSLVPEDKKIAIPFILASSPSGSQIDCEMTENRSEYCISFQHPFKLYTEVQILEMMNMMPMEKETSTETQNKLPNA